MATGSVMPRSLDAVRGVAGFWASLSPVFLLVMDSIIR
jgi:hypothetical protein